MNGQAESFTNVKGTSILSGITLGNTTIEKDATLVVDERDFEFGYHDYNENGHLLTNNGTILIKNTDSEFKIEQGNTIINNGTIENNGTYINEGKTKYEIIIENIPGCEITSNVTIAEEGEKIQLTTELKEGYTFKGYKAYKIDDKNTVVKIEDNSFIMPEYAVVIEAIVEEEQRNLVEEENKEVLPDKKDETPKMGSSRMDNTFLFIGLIVMSLIGIANTKKSN